MSTLTVYPSGYDTNKSVFSGVPTSPENAYTSYTDTTFARYNLVQGANARTYIYFTFDLSSIPSNATINSVSCIAKVQITDETSGRIAIRQLQLYSGNTPKGTASSFSKAETPCELDTGSWTREELDNLFLRVYVERGTLRTTTSYPVLFTGADLTIEYTVGGSTQTLKIKSNGSWTDVSKVYKKESGSWVEQASLDTLFDTTANYVKSN